MLEALQRLIRSFNPPSYSGRQAGALPFRIAFGEVQVLLITSRRSGKWMFPKGALEDGLTPAESAAREALEEAGVTGQIADTPIGSYRSSSGQEVEIFPLDVLDILPHWKEQGQRIRHWATVRDARRMLADPQMVRLVVALDKRLGSRRKSA
jgi:8-oxo-dGTP pyrophosphatase MutT (NUDIX family)